MTYIKTSQDCTVCCVYFVTAPAKKTHTCYSISYHSRFNPGSRTVSWIHWLPKPPLTAAAQLASTAKIRVRCGPQEPGAIRHPECCKDWQQPPNILQSSAWFSGYVLHRATRVVIKVCQKMSMVKQTMTPRIKNLA